MSVESVRPIPDRLQPGDNLYGLPPFNTLLGTAVIELEERISSLREGRSTYLDIATVLTHIARAKQNPQKGRKAVEDILEDPAGSVAQERQPVYELYRATFRSVVLATVADLNNEYPRWDEYIAGQVATGKFRTNGTYVSDSEGNIKSYQQWDADRQGTLSRRIMDPPR